jgi:hypothetical protein
MYADHFSLAVITTNKPGNSSCHAKKAGHDWATLTLHSRTATRECLAPDQHVSLLGRIALAGNSTEKLPLVLFSLDTSMKLRRPRVFGQVDAQVRATVCPEVRKDQRTFAAGFGYAHRPAGGGVCCS